MAPCVTRLRNVLGSKRAAVQAAVYDALFKSIWRFNSKKPRGEVATLISFFVGLPKLEATLNTILKPSGVTTAFKGIFCHLSGGTGPIVDFSMPPGDKGCEICDLLVIVTYGTGTAATLGNACFLQAKSRREDLDGSGSTARQRDLYERAPLFKFRKSEKYVSAALGEHAIPGTREMPSKSSSAFCYWPFATHRSEECRINSSSVIMPIAFEDQSDDVPFPEAIHDLMMGELGLPVVAPVPGEFGWNRIVHDVILRAMSEALRCSAGIADVKNCKRVRSLDHASLSALLSKFPALVMNPFGDLADAFGSLDLKNISKDLSEKSRLSSEHMDSMLNDTHGGGKDPPKKEVLADEAPEGSGGAAFIQIHLSSKNLTGRKGQS